MKLFIPACGDRIRLSKDWNFDLYLEARNIAFAKVRNIVDQNFPKYGGVHVGGQLKHVIFQLPQGTILECDRVYIRTFSKSALSVGNDYDSITWKIVKDDKIVRNSRFWVKLPDCYEIEYEQEDVDLYRNRVKAVKFVHEI